ncbi:MAG: hypothetical protein US25_C0006G0012 [Candidatus Moranbacteria bacterium GW2011_GWE1_36_7]|nr:MAG: hypothetical protein UR99_C0002G0013 [Candidatus Moranbacteria bacterium GW2011_GWD2_36_12]KKQ07038.1 MAG: hypothetical protein US16_C0003G0013 [Candidatus Moranbacteria bacterium GW2011_GWE2_36_40]KKQ15384.1 MAG: hypothetical protein US25_C0006G0012 [Candidatus Moranbacteria bacterium GW2011_GWE1_36_7]
MTPKLRIFEMYLTVTMLSFQMLRAYVDENERGKRLDEEFMIKFDFQEARQDISIFDLKVMIYPLPEKSLTTFINQLTELDYVITSINQIVSETKETAMTQVKTLS